jgi:hypothetical protein
MPELPKPKRVDIWYARKYIKEECGSESFYDVDSAFFDALCSDELHCEGELNTPASYTNKEPTTKIERVPYKFWKDWGYNAFECAGKLHSYKLRLSDHYGPYYCNLTIATADIDAWLSTSQNPKVRVIAVPEKTYKERVEKALSINESYSRGEDREWAKARGFSVESVDEMRKLHAPPEWQEKGRRSNKTSRN